MILRLSLCLGLLAVSSIASAADPAPAAAPTAAAPAAAPAAAEAAPAAPAVDPNEQVCKVERVLGSNKMKRVCRTRAQIEVDRDAAREALSREQRR